jgi:long-chain acyl-CoA synthetase
MVDDQPVTLVELLCKAAAKRPSTEVLRFKQDKVWTGMPGAELLSRVTRVALALREIGVRKGDAVAMLAESGPLWSITDYSILSNGGVNVPLYPTQPVDQVEYILRDSRPRLMFVSTARQMRRIAEAVRKFPDLRIITFQPGVEGENVTSFEELERRGEALSREEAGVFEAMISDVKPDDLASIIYTSGTTGEPKGVMLTHSNIVFNALAAGRFLGIEEGGVMLSYLPLSHIFERMVLYLCLQFGVQINYAGGIETVANDMKEVHPTLMSTVPRMLEKVYSRMQKNAKDGGRLRNVIFDWSLDVGRSVATLSSEGKRIPPIILFKREIADRLVFAKLREAVGGRIRRMVSGGAALPSDGLHRRGDPGAPGLRIDRNIAGHSGEYDRVQSHWSGRESLAGHRSEDSRRWRDSYPRTSRLPRLLQQGGGDRQCLFRSCRKRQPLVQDR